MIGSVMVQAWRSWRSAKSVGLLAIVALAAGVGSATAIYSVVNGVLLKPIPYAEGDRAVMIFGASLSQPEQRSALSFVDAVEYERRLQSFDLFGFFKPGNYNLTSPGEPQNINGVEMTQELAAGLGVPPMRGRWFGDDPTGAVISHELWRRLGEDPAMTGKLLVLNGRSYRITGVMPPSFVFPLRGPGISSAVNHVWLPLDRNAFKGSTLGHFFSYARRKPGVTLEQAEADVKRVAAQIAQENPLGHPSYTAKVDDLHGIVVKDVRPTLLLLLGAAALLLLITCTSVAGLLVARSVARARETAVRVALGAGQGQLALEYLTESLLVAVPGAALGLLLSLMLVRAVLGFARDFVPRADEISLDWRVLVFALSMALLAAVLTSLAPLWQSMRTQPNDVLNEGVRASAGVRGRRITHGLVIAEIALAFILLATSAALLSHLDRLRRTYPGFDIANLLTFQITLPDAVMGDEPRRVATQQRLIESLQAIPGVEAVATVNQLPLNGCCLATVIFPEGRANDPNAVERTSLLPVSPQYWRTMRIPLRSGRLLEERDAGDKHLLAVINRAAAVRDWPDQDAVGAYGRLGSVNGTRFQVVGVSANVRNDTLATAPVPEIYLLASQIPANPLYFVMRSARSADQLTSDVRRVLRDVDPTLPIYGVATMVEMAAASVTLERLRSFTVGSFGMAALLMAALGIYGVVAYSVRQKTVEIGTRMALGAEHGDVLRLVVYSGLKMALYGVLAGVLGMTGALLLLERFMVVPEVGRLPFVYAGLIVAAVALVASLFPAWRATLLSPMVAIRNDAPSLWSSLGESFQARLRRDADGTAAVTPLSPQELTEFTQVSRSAGSFGEALQNALSVLARRIDAQTAWLLDQRGNVFEAAAVVGGAAPLTLPANGFTANHAAAFPHPRPIQAADIAAWKRWAAELRPQHLPELDALEAARIRLAAGLRTGNELTGLLLFGPPVEGKMYGTGDRQLLDASAGQLALLMENGRLTQRVIEQEKIRRDIALAAEVQKRLLPERPPETALAALAAASLPARSVGGDYYDFLQVGDRAVAIALADVSGKGIAAALIMSVVQASLRVLLSEGNITIPQLAAKMNQFLHKSTNSNSYATFFYAQINEDGRRLNYVNAGHNPPYLVRALDSNFHREIEELKAGGTVLGLFPTMSYQEASVDLAPGDVLVAFTDGVTEAMSPTEEEFGEDRLKGLLRRIAHLPVQEISSRISEELKNWIRDADQHDDLTFVVMKVN